MSNFLSLVHISKFFQKFMKVSAKDICNKIILTRHSLLHSIFQSTTCEDWIVPSITVSDSFFSNFGQHISVLSDAGPEYLYFLENVVSCESGFAPYDFERLKELKGNSKSYKWEVMANTLLSRYLRQEKDNGFRLPKGLLWYYRLKHQYDMNGLQKMLWIRK